VFLLLNLPGMSGSSKGEPSPKNVPTEMIYKLESAERSVWKDFYLAASPTVSERLGIEFRLEKGAAIGIVAKSGVLALNRVLALGLDEPMTEDHLDGIIAAYRSSGVGRFFVTPPPCAKPADFAELLARKDLCHYNNWVKLYREVAPPPLANTNLEVREIGADEAPVFGRIFASCVEWPEPAGEWLAATVGRPGWKHYMAFFGSEPAGTGAMFVHDKTAYMGFASTLPEYRGRGAQSALVVRRIEAASFLGCQLITAETAQDRPDRPALSYRNLVRLGFTPAYVRPNYLGTL
jgi:GNAT superfamily N-acetyltransferase